jgi:hypothetical protein
LVRPHGGVQDTGTTYRNFGRRERWTLASRSPRFLGGTSSSYTWCTAWRHAFRRRSSLVGRTRIRVEKRTRFRRSWDRYYFRTMSRGYERKQKKKKKNNKWNKTWRGPALEDVSARRPSTRNRRIMLERLDGSRGTVRCRYTGPQHESPGGRNVGLLYVFPPIRGGVATTTARNV